MTEEKALELVKEIRKKVNDSRQSWFIAVMEMQALQIHLLFEILNEGKKKTKEDS